MIKPGHIITVILSTTLIGSMAHASHKPGASEPNGSVRPPAAELARVGVGDIAPAINLINVGPQGLPTAGPSPDCNLNGTADDVDIAGGTSADCQLNGTPDECELGENDCNNNGAPDDCDLKGDGGPRHYAIPVEPPAPIADFTTASHTFNLPDEGAIQDVDVDVTLTHTWSSDLVISVTHEATTVILFEHQCGSEDNFDGTIWDDEAGGSISCTAGHVGTFTPFEALAAFDGLEASGDWTIEVADTVGGDSGALSAWSLRIKGIVSRDCDDNGTPDECDPDCNANGIPDACDIAEGTSQDCQSDGVPDECQLGNTPRGNIEYAVDDGTQENGVTLSGGGSLAWLNHFTVVAGAEIITTINIAYGPASDGLALTAYLWNDPNGDGDPSDATVLASAPAVVANANTNVFNPIDLPDTLVGPVGTSFFVGAIIQQPPLEAPAAIDSTASQGQSWVAADTSSVNPNNLGAGDIGFGLIDNIVLPGNWLIRAEGSAQGADCNTNGIPDECDIADETSQDCNTNAIPDECELGSSSGTFEHTIPVSPAQPISNTLPPATHTFTVPEGGAILDVDVGVTLTHTWSSDLEIRVTHGATTVLLFDNQCGSEDNFNATVWDDEAATTIVCTAGHMGTFQPFSPLSAFDGAEASGPWTISVTDNVGGDSGTLTGWLLRLNLAGQTNDCDNNGTLDECDPDCNTNGTPDACDIAAGTSLDCNSNVTPDECELAGNDCNSNGIPDDCELDNGTLTFQHNIPVVPPQPINKAAAATHNFFVTEVGPLQDVDVDVTLTHTWSSDLVISVTHEETTVILFEHQCGSEDDFDGTIWDDEAAGAIACTAGHVGSFTPFEPLSAFDGQEAFGVWTISVQDTVGGDVGELTGWSLRIGASCPELIVCPDDAKTTCELGIAPSVTGTPTPTDSCGGAPDVTYRDEIEEGPCPTQFTITRTWIASDACGHTDSCVQIIDLTDRSPELICPPGADLLCTDSTHPDDLGYATLEGLCNTGAEITYTDRFIEDECPQVLRRRWRAWDVCGRRAGYCDQYIKIGNDGPPVFDFCPPEVTVPCGASTDPEDTGEATATDGCTEYPWITYTDKGKDECPDTIERTWRATDDCEDFSECVQLINVEAPPPCPRLPYYWKNHPDDWPADSLALGAVTYDSTQLMNLLNGLKPDGSPANDDATVPLSRFLIAVEFSLLAGSPPDGIQPTVDAAHAFLTANPVGSNPTDAARATALALRDALRDYANSEPEGCSD